MSVYTNDIDTLRQMISQSTTAIDQQCDNDCQCICQYVDPEYSIDGSDQ